MKKKYQVFISSTYTDLKEERLAVTKRLLDNNCIPVGMEQFPASGMSQMDYIKKMLDDCDYYLLILAGRYGSLDSDNKSFTEKEFDYADSLGIPIMSFVFKDLNQLVCEKSEETATLKAKLSKFREKVCRGRLVKFYNTIDKLEAEVATSINQCINDSPAIGWIRDDSTLDNNIENKITSYLEEHTISPEEIDDLFDNTESSINHKKLFSSNSVSEQYISAEKSGYFTFDYSNNNGEFIIGSGENTFLTKWSKGSNTSIHAYKDGIGITEIARVKAPVKLNNALESPCDFSSRTRTPQLNDVIIWKNEFGKYAGTKIISIKDDTRGDDHDELCCEYAIYDWS